jgi:hypothetical protein
MWAQTRLHRADAMPEGRKCVAFTHETSSPIAQHRLSNSAQMTKLGLGLTTTAKS